MQLQNYLNIAAIIESRVRINIIGYVFTFNHFKSKISFLHLTIALIVEIKSRITPVDNLTNSISNLLKYSR